MAEWSADIEVDTDRAARWIAARFPELAHHSVRLSGEGWDNAVFRVGPELVFRIPRRRIGAALLEMELGVLPHLARHVPIAIPDPIYRGAPGPDFPYWFAGYHWLDGETADRMDPDDTARAALAQPLGRVLRALHHADPGTQADAADPGDTLHRADCRRRLPTLLERLAALEDLPVARNAVRNALVALAETPPWDGSPRWVHGDLYPRHLILDGAGALVGLIDFGDCHRGDPAIDLSIAWTFLPTAAHDAFRAAYGEDDPATWDRARFRALHYGINLLRYGNATDDRALIATGERALLQAVSP